MGYAAIKLKSIYLRLRRSPKWVVIISVIREYMRDCLLLEREISEVLAQIILQISDQGHLITELIISWQLIWRGHRPIFKDKLSNNTGHYSTCCPHLKSEYCTFSKILCCTFRDNEIIVVCINLILYSSVLGHAISYKPKWFNWFKWFNFNPSMDK